jgi:uncharacterized protein YjbI with pentapeptide repeats
MTTPSSSSVPPQSSPPDATATRPTAYDADAWKAYWQAQEVPWRSEAEIPTDRQTYLAELRAISPDIEQGIYPFKGVEPKLTRADIEWLLATHESRGVIGPVIWEQEKDKLRTEQRQGLDLRGADLVQVDLSNLPLARLRAGVTFDEYIDATDSQRRAATTHMEGANLTRAHLEGATLIGAHLKEANLHRANLERADLTEAQLERVDLGRAQLKETYLTGAQLEGADLGTGDLERANLRRAKLKRANLRGAQLKGANLRGADLEGADLIVAQLEEANLTGAQLKKANLIGAQLKEANFGQAYLNEANLTGAQLQGTDLRRAQMEGATLIGARLEGAILIGAHLAGADLRLAFFSDATALNNLTLFRSEHGAARLADARWGGVNLAVIAWGSLVASGLGDEQAARNWRSLPPPSSDVENKRSRKKQTKAGRRWRDEQSATRLLTFQEAVRANRQLAAALRDQGLNEEADHFAYRAQVLQRSVFAQQGRWFRSLLWGFLDLIAGHGYKPQRSIAFYVLVIAVFTGLFLLAGIGVITFGLPPTEYHQLPWYEALVLSVASFHGRGFFQPVHSPGDPIAILAAIEAVFGLFIEVAFIATFTQRFFGK